MVEVVMVEVVMVEVVMVEVVMVEVVMVEVVAGEAWRARSGGAARKIRAADGNCGGAGCVQ
ncbi:hypothetical protein [Streptomyces paradoxus]|uniref:hypothetical protein n=1 Tax=Streptomyces paradoxus TaxID=66375 RepID=UPI0037D17543